MKSVNIGKNIVNIDSRIAFVIMTGAGQFRLKDLGRPAHDRLQWRGSRKTSEPGGVTRIF